MQPSDLRALRKSAKMTQAELGEAIGLTQGYIGEMERGEKPIEKRTAIAVLCVVEHQHDR